MRLLIWFKQRFPFVWSWAEAINGLFFSILSSREVQKNLADHVSRLAGGESLEYRFLNANDLDALGSFFESQDQDQFIYFKPHPFDRKTLGRLFRNPAFFMLGVFDQGKLAGYFFLRCFVNKKCFTGRIIDGRYQGRGISKIIGRILLGAAWESKFRVFGTASRDNIKSLGSYKSINDFKIIKELDNNFIYFEYLKEKQVAAPRMADEAMMKS